MAPPPVGMPEGQAMLREGPYSSDPGYYMYGPGPGPGGNPPPGLPGGLPPQGGPPFPYYGDGMPPMYRGRGGHLRGRGRGMRRGSEFDYINFLMFLLNGDSPLIATLTGYAQCNFAQVSVFNSQLSHSCVRDQ